MSPPTATSTKSSAATGQLLRQQGQGAALPTSQVKISAGAAVLPAGAALAVGAVLPGAVLEEVAEGDGD
jgi:hypothetical protein